MTPVADRGHRLDLKCAYLFLRWKWRPGRSPPTGWSPRTQSTYPSRTFSSSWRRNHTNYLDFFLFFETHRRLSIVPIESTVQKSSYNPPSVKAIESQFTQHISSRLRTAEVIVESVFKPGASFPYFVLIFSEWRRAAGTWPSSRTGTLRMRRFGSLPQATRRFWDRQPKPITAAPPKQNTAGTLPY